MPRVVHFEIATDDPDRAITFYTSLFGWKFNKWDGGQPYWLIDTGTGDGINGGMYVRGGSPIDSCNTIDVPDVDAYLAKIADAGGEVIMPKMELPGLGYLAYCTDTEGNQFGVWQKM